MESVASGLFLQPLAVSSKDDASMMDPANEKTTDARQIPALRNVLAKKQVVFIMKQACIRLRPNPPSRRRTGQEYRLSRAK
jgi:hypothetical protein